VYITYRQLLLCSGERYVLNTNDDLLSRHGIVFPYQLDFSSSVFTSEIIISTPTIVRIMLNLKNNNNEYLKK
jgi:hypothetical protein